MNPSLNLITQGVLLGLGAAAPIGPVNVEIARRTLLGGFRAGAAVGAGAVTVDIACCALAAFGFRFVSQVEALKLPLQIVGIAMLTLLGVLSFRGAIRALRSEQRTETATHQPGFTGGYLTGLAMTAVNPITIIFWFTAVTAKVASLSEQAGRLAPMICVGVLIGCGGWVIGFAGALKLAGRWRRRWWMIAADAFGGATLLGFAGWELWKLVR